MRRESSSREECSSSALQDEEKTLSLTAKNSIQGTDDGTKTRRTVRFQASPSQVVAHLPTLREMDEDQKRRLWWSMSDYEVFTDTARNISKEVRRHSALTVGLDDAWRKAIQASKNVDQVDDAMQQISLDPGLAHWCTHGHSRRGLERWGSMYHCSSRNKGADLCKSTVINLSLTSDELAVEASRLSLSSRIFARMMGEADEVASFRTQTELRRWSDMGGNYRVRSIHRTSSLPTPGLVRTTF